MTAVSSLCQHVSEGKSNQHSILRDALQRTVEYNSNILEQRRQRCVYLDTQTRVRGEGGVCEMERMVCVR